MSPGPFRLDIDASPFVRYAEMARKNIEKGTRSYYRKGGQVLVRAQRIEATDRFGVEQAESGMKTAARDRPRASRPKGSYAGSVRAQVVGGAMHVGPNQPYGWWIEMGSDAPGGTIPATHRGASFRGHRPIQRSIESSKSTLRDLFRSEMKGVF